MSEYKSKEVVVNQARMTLFNKFTDFQGLLSSVPQEHRDSVSVEGDTVRFSYAGFSLGIKISEKVPFSKICYTDVEAPFHFTAEVHLDPAELITQTTLWVKLDADLNFMMKALIGNKLQEYLDKVVTMIGTGGVI